MTAPNASGDMEQLELSHTAGRSDMTQPPRVLQFLINTNVFMTKQFYYLFQHTRKPSRRLSLLLAVSLVKSKS